MIPLKDANPTRRRAVVTFVLIAINVVVYFGVQPNPQDPATSTTFTYEHAAIPCELTTNEPLSDVEITTDTCNQQAEGPPHFAHKSVWLAVLVSMFLHGSLVHLGGNMLYLWIFGNNIEDQLGRARYLGFYLIGGVAATIAYVLAQPTSTIPMIGASGAIAAVMGAYLAWFPNVRIRALLFIFLRDITAKWLLIFWFVSQFFTDSSSGVAWMAHVGGFVFGFLVGLVMRATRGAQQQAQRGRY